MSTEMRQEVLARPRRRFATAGREHKAEIHDQAVELLSYRRKAALGRLGAAPSPPRALVLHLVWAKTYHPEALLPVLKPI